MLGGDKGGFANHSAGSRGSGEEDVAGEYEGAGDAMDTILHYLLVTERP